MERIIASYKEYSEACLRFFREDNSPFGVSRMKPRRMDWYSIHLPTLVARALLHGECSLRDIE
jgi:hypothetical protein